MRTKHTPGPWFIGKRDRFGNRVYVTYLGVDGLVCDHIENPANARIIAAAPELLEACKYAIELITIARRYFPKSVKNRDKFNLENTCATLNKAIAACEDEPK